MTMRFYTLSAPLDASAPGAPGLAQFIEAMIAAAPGSEFDVIVDDVLPAANADDDGRGLLARALAADGALALDAAGMRLLARAIAQPIDVSVCAHDQSVELIIEDGDALSVCAGSAASLGAIAAALAGADR